MVLYELLMIYRPLEKKKLIESIKKTCHEIIQRGGILKSFENLGKKKLPYRMQIDREYFYDGRYTGFIMLNLNNPPIRYYIINFNLPPSLANSLTKKLGMSSDTIRRRMCRKMEEISRPCTKEPCDYGEMDKDIYSKINNYRRQFIVPKEF
ncbi:putative 28S ribosomal protein S6, mitochondrial [Intoshia linei]|uniref:Small ribosomal subunit protein bS6m n=1 Tax=Intoshia linei TaxID=1819745 RepID=A0A177ASL3_9BILA|nr:putative 28S ribosomal protein S6, mitochondrial [Intoshia linei]